VVNLYNPTACDFWFIEHKLSQKMDVRFADHDTISKDVGPENSSLLNRNFFLSLPKNQLQTKLFCSPYIPPPGTSPKPFGWLKSIIFGSLLVLFATAGKIFFKKMTNNMPQYPLFLSLFEVVAALPLYFAMMLFFRYKKKQDVKGIRAHWTQRLKEDMNDRMSSVNQSTGDFTCVAVDEKYWRIRARKGFDFPKHKILLMGFLDSLSVLLMMIGGTGTPGPLQALLFQAVIPFTMFISFIFLKERYSLLEYVSAFVLLVGAFVSFLPSLFELQEKGVPILQLVWVVSTIPVSISSVYKEYCLKNKFVNVFYLQAWITLFQLLGLFLLAPLNCIPPFGNLKLADIPLNLWQGFHCFLGIPTNPQYDHCDDAWINVIAYNICHIAFSICMLTLLKHLSCVVAYLQSAIRLPLITIAFHIPLIMGKDAEPWNAYSWFVWAGLFIILWSLFVFMIETMKKQKRKQKLKTKASSLDYNVDYPIKFTASRTITKYFQDQNAETPQEPIFRNSLPHNREIASTAVVNVPSYSVLNTQNLQFPRRLDFAFSAPEVYANFSKSGTENCPLSSAGTETDTETAPLIGPLSQSPILDQKCETAHIVDDENLLDNEAENISFTPHLFN
jgi:drug/metabolite transporter (DMT)-like permease